MRLIGKTQRAEQILRKMKARDRRPHKVYNGPTDTDFLVQETTPATGEKVLDEFNQSTLDSPFERRFMLADLGQITHCRNGCFIS